MFDFLFSSASSGMQLTSYDFAPLATAVLQSSVAIFVFALMTALISHSILDLVGRRIAYRFVFRRWEQDVERKDFKFWNDDYLPASAFNLANDRFTALVSNRLRMSLERLYEPQSISSKPLSDRARVRYEREALESRRMLATLDQAVDELQTALLGTDRLLRYGLSLIVPTGLYILLLFDSSLPRPGNVLLLCCGTCVALLAAWIQSVEIRMIRAR